MKTVTKTNCHTQKKRQKFNYYLTGVVMIGTSMHFMLYITARNQEGPL